MQLIKYCDEWIVFDDVQYISRGWINRNRIIHPSKLEALYISVPVKLDSHNDKIKDVLIDISSDYINKIMGQLESSYKKRAPYYKEVSTLIEECLKGRKEKLLDLHIYSLEKICDYIGIEFKYKIFSEMNIDLPVINDPGEWAPYISNSEGADVYVNPPGGKDLFNQSLFDSLGVSLEFLSANFKEYNQKKKSFLPGLSIIDIMMFNSTDEIQTMLSDFNIN